ncbi:MULTISPECIES: peptidoglycan-binding protein [Halomonas]|uniref:peptidoglycan-binding protein n=1 Tax=Halomonas TaxID=2745 RepID=UPI001866FDD8|nr:MULTISPECIES: peptidoglycan-binding protein [Halomonas]
MKMIETSFTEYGIVLANFMRRAARQNALCGVLKRVVSLLSGLLISLHAVGAETLPVVTLSPQIRTLPMPDGALDARVSELGALSLESLNAFWREHRVIEAGVRQPEMAYVLAGEHQRLINGAGDRIYARGAMPSHALESVPSNVTNRATTGLATFGIYRQTQTYTADDGAVLGQALSHIGEARLVRSEEDIALLEVLSAHQEVRSNDLILALEPDAPRTALQPRLPSSAINGRILAVPGGVRFIGALHIIALDVGAQDGLEPGHLLQVNSPSETVFDARRQAVTPLPPSPAGWAMVVKPYQQVSYALVMQASSMLEVGDRVVTPDL